MYVKRLTGLSGEKSSVFCYPDLLDTGPVFMFGTFDLADGTSRGSGYALDEAILGTRKMAQWPSPSAFTPVAKRRQTEAVAHSCSGCALSSH